MGFVMEVWWTWDATLTFCPAVNPPLGAIVELGILYACLLHSSWHPLLLRLAIVETIVCAHMRKGLKGGAVVELGNVVWLLSGLVGTLGTYCSNKGTLCAVSWIILNIILNFLNKILFVEESFKFPLFIIIVGTLSTFFGCCFMVYVLGAAKVNLGRAMGHWKVLIVLAFVHGANSGLTNMSMVYISIGLSQVIKVTTPAWALALERVFFGRVEPNAIVAATFITIAGAAVAVMESPEADGTSHNAVLGGLMALGSAILGAVQIIIVARLLQDLQPPMTSTELILVTSIPMALFLVPGFLTLEADELVRHLFNRDINLLTEMMVVVSGILAFAYTLMTYLLIKYTSPLVSLVIGNFKVVLLVALSMAFFHTPWTWLNVFGVGITLIGFGLFNVLKYQQKQLAAAVDTRTPRRTVIQLGNLTMTSPRKDLPA